MQGYQVYQHYVALKAHFSGRYDYFKYNGKTSVKYSTYEKRNDKHFFELVGKKVEDRDIVPLMVANFVNNEDVWVGELIENYEEAKDVYAEWKKKMSTLYIVYTEDLNNINDFLDKNSLKFKDIFYYGNDHPIIFRFLLQEMIEIETFILLNNLIHFVDKMNETFKNDIIWNNKIDKIKKYNQFVVYDKEKVKKITLDLFK